jgi:twitching motility protein PilJ
LYQEGRVRAIDNIYQAELTECHIKTLERFEVKANLVAPILKDNQLLGLLIAHHCAETRALATVGDRFIHQLATQIGFAIDQANLLEQVEKSRRKAEAISQQQRHQKEALQDQLLKLLNDVEEAARGNLTVRAEVTAGEIGTVADFFNSIIENLGQLVTQVKKTAVQVNVSVSENAGAVRHLADAALNQAEEITYTLDSVEADGGFIQEVADSAQQAAAVARTASSTAQAGGAAMNRTVQSILNLRETVAETANKVKRLGESSQQISKVVSLIHQIALQTNVLAINASIERLVRVLKVKDLQ